MRKYDRAHLLDEIIINDGKEVKRCEQYSTCWRSFKVSVIVAGLMSQAAACWSALQV